MVGAISREAACQREPSPAAAGPRPRCAGRELAEPRPARPIPPACVPAAGFEQMFGVQFGLQSERHSAALDSPQTLVLRALRTRLAWISPAGGRAVAGSNSVSPMRQKARCSGPFARDDELRPWQAMFHLCSILRLIEDMRVEARRVRAEQGPLAPSDLDGLD
jgi:hypothetical protein